jgi:hypothetical protein
MLIDSGYIDNPQNISKIMEKMEEKKKLENKSE